MAVTVYSQGQAGAGGLFTWTLDFDDAAQNLGLTCTLSGDTTAQISVVVLIGQVGVIALVPDSLADGARHIVAGVGAVAGSLWTSAVTQAMIGQPPYHNTSALIGIDVVTNRP